MSNLEAMRHALQVSPDNVPLLLLFARACADEFHADDALSAYERALTHEPGNRVAKLGIARVLYLIGRTSEAEVRLESLLREAPQDVEAHRLMSRVLLSEGNVDEARKIYSRSLSFPDAEADPELERELSERSRQGAAPAPPLLRVPEGGHAEPDEDGEMPGASALPVERPDITFADVGGMESVKEELRQKILHPLAHPELYRAYGKAVGGGVLLFGPPGCGKTHISRALAGETESRMIQVGLHDILDLYHGNSEKALHGVFQTARDAAPCTLFIDEVDALAANRTDMRHSAGRTLINQFLLELESGPSENEGVLVIGATNAPWHMDPAFLRPGRFDRILFVPPPDEEARAAILEILTRDKPRADLETRAVAQKTEGFSGADLRNLIDQALERCLVQARKRGAIVPLTTKECMAAVRDQKASTRAWFETAKNYAIYSNAGGLYDGVLSYLGIRK